MKQFRQRLRNLTAAAIKALRSARGRNILLYLLFVCVAFVFWMLLSLESEVQRNYDLPLQLDNVPDSVIVVRDLPPVISTTVQGKGAQLVRFLWGKPSPLKITYDTSTATDGVCVIQAQKVEARLRDYFGGGVMIMSAKPDSLVYSFTTGQGRRVPLKVKVDVTTSLQSIQSGEPTASVDSVTLYAIGHIPSSVTSVTTEPVSLVGLKDTARVQAKVIVPEGMRAIPDQVFVTIPVEPLVSKKHKINIEPTMLPHGTRMLLFPSSVEVTLLVPMSKYSDDYPLHAFVSYPDAVKSKSGRVAVQLGPFPGRYYSITQSTDSVEFVIEHE